MRRIHKQQNVSELPQPMDIIKSFGKQLLKKLGSLSMGRKPPVAAICAVIRITERRGAKFPSDRRRFLPFHDFDMGA